MALAFFFTPKSMSGGQYNEVIRRLEQAGEGKPAGRLYHACYGTGNELRVVDVWDSAENFDRFGKTLLPILQELNLEVGQPEVVPVHNTVPG